MTAASIAHESHHDDSALALYREVADIRLLGFVLFLISDCVLFSSFIFAYIYMRNAAPVWPPAGVGQPDANLAAVNSIVLFGSGATMHFAMENWKHGTEVKFRRWLVATIVLGAMFLGGQGWEYTHINATWSGSTFGAAFFTLTGMHGFHVFCGVIYLIVLWAQTGRHVYTNDRYFGLTAGTLYW
ncbi:MAG TPA: cytochrome c oxidase subunit 3, partial [Candidatus Acidoferrales bacterium]|nr:cytochrome c oxidase subunit 3 [Candidatus Acidoferrales bacterium]